ncbi:unnamed protein product [Kuraishia capsulata CBS 1993]|uniref:Uncharacterized protein n=1 Tax=Kuraishia capsulata CBS 1993 TaxID=1382522 RepID=W6MLV0_9ASCO|nr:uncharacterized protein KUCA_T00003100001 [Kuraishia capsulata CBS 1993]CDK27123.1 unnamed protein product [Kuraishia capsulata CBS 1993]
METIRNFAPCIYFVSSIVALSFWNKLTARGHKMDHALQESLKKAFNMDLQTPEMEAETIPEISFPGGVAMIKVKDQTATCWGGFALRYKDAKGHNLEREKWIEMTEDKIFDSEFKSPASMIFSDY